MKDQYLIGESIAAVDLFCGVGGLTHGLERAGIDVRLGVDIDPSCTFAFEANNRARFLAADVADLSPDVVKTAYDGASVSLLAGCAPCQPFSTYARSARREPTAAARRGRGRSEDWRLVETFHNLVTEVGPDLVTMENVPPLVDQTIFQNLVGELRKNYDVACDIVECRMIGLPQTRRRLVLLASRFGPISLPHFEIPEVSVRKTIGSLPALSAGEQDPNDPLHCASRLSAKNLQRIKASRPDGTWRDWPDALKADCHSRASGATYPSVYGRMRWEEPAPTITTQAFGFGNGRFGHPEQDRAISLREAAMLQGFPREYQFVRDGDPVTFSTLGRLIGNAVPVPLGQIIGEVLQEHVRRMGQ